MSSTARTPSQGNPSLIIWIETWSSVDTNKAKLGTCRTNKFGFHLLTYILLCNIIYLQLVSFSEHESHIDSIEENLLYNVSVTGDGNVLHRITGEKHVVAGRELLWSLWHGLSIAAGWLKLVQQLKWEVWATNRITLMTYKWGYTDNFVSLHWSPDYVILIASF